MRGIEQRAANIFSRSSVRRLGALQTGTLARSPLTIVAAVAWLAGCGRAQPELSTPGLAQPAAYAVDRDHWHARIDGDIAKWDLLYVSNLNGRSQNGTVTVYRYWHRTLVETLTNFKTPEGACVDVAGDVYIADWGANDVGGGDPGSAYVTENPGYGGGGGSDVREGVDRLKDRVLVAAGGGGQGGSGSFEGFYFESTGGNGGGAEGDNGHSPFGGGGGGGSQTQGGAGGAQTGQFGLCV